jgi:hypothetical protein
MKTFKVKRFEQIKVWQEAEICFETEIATGNYQWADKQISQLVEMDK